MITDHTHRLTSTPDSTTIRIMENHNPGRWWVELTAEKTAAGVELRVLDHLVVRFTAEEARDFAKAFARMMTGEDERAGRL